VPKHKLLIICLVFFSLVFVPIAEAKKRRSSNFEQGRLQFEQGNHTRALSFFDRALRGAKSKSSKIRANYYQGLVLFELGYYYSSYMSFREVLNTASKKHKQYYEKAIKNAVIITDRLSMVDRVGKLLQRLPSGYIASSVGHMANYAIGVNHYFTGNFSKAAGHLKAVHPQSQFYLKSMAYLGILATRTKNYKDAIFYFNKVVQLTRGSRREREVRELAKLNLARSVYAYGNVDKAIELYSRFSSSSPYWLEILFEASWPLMRVNDHTISLGNLRTLISPFYRDGMVGEAYVLRATILFSLCKYEEMRRSLAQFFQIYDPVLSAMNRERNKLKSDGRFFRAMEARKGLNRAFMSFVNRDEGIRKQMKIRKLLQTERNRLARYSRNKQMKKMRKLITREERQIERGVDRTLRTLHKRKLADLIEQREQANYLKVELVTGEKELIQKQGGLPPRRILDVETSIAEDYHFYPFRGEYWDDELGSYVYTTTSSCVD